MVVLAFKEIFTINFKDSMIRFGRPNLMSPKLVYHTVKIDLNQHLNYKEGSSHRELLY